MAPKRRAGGQRSGTGTASRQQSTLSFHGKSGAITKLGATEDAKTNRKDPALVETLVATELRPKEPTTAEKAIEQQTEVERPQTPETTTTPLRDPLADEDHETKTEDVLGGRAEISEVGAVGGPHGSGWLKDEEAQARKITDAQIKRYWRDKEATRLAPRVHQEGLSVYEKALREWDMSGQYGPCIGIARLKRWKRANMLGLDPPMEILAILLKELEAGESKSQRAHVDELLSSRFIET